jgi:2-succinyl-5-enolpyruvyl-6-hydroxy-3-cyclohexene-1-carboxylate synthase
MYGLHYENPATMPAFRQALASSFNRDGVTLIEVRTERMANVDIHRDLWAGVSAAVAALPGGA